MKKWLKRGSWQDAAWLIGLPIPALMLAGAIAHSPTAIFIGFLSVIAYLLASAKFVAWTLEADVDRHLNDKIVRKILGKSLSPANRNW